MGLSIDGAFTCQARLLLWRYVDADLVRNGLCDLALQRKNTGEVAHIVTCPDVIVGPGIDQLDCDSHLVMLTQN